MSQPELNVRRALTLHFQKDFDYLGIGDQDPLVFPASRPEFGDYQVNGVMAAAKRTGANPRTLAQQVVACPLNQHLSAVLELAGPGFINLRLSNEFLKQHINRPFTVQSVAQPERIVVDYSSPNIAKELHVGHLRSTVIGDAIVRMLTVVGHKVERQNHVGDWGTSFGKLVAYLDEQDTTDHQSLRDLEKLYVDASRLYDSDPRFAHRARAAVVALQTKNANEYSIWKEIIAASVSHISSIYEKLNVLLTPDDIRGESSYNDELPTVIEDLAKANLITISDGAKCVFIDGFVKKDGTALPMIVQKSDGGYLYHTTDLAALKYRVSQLRAQRILYLTDSRQIHHFEHLFAVGRAAKYVSEEIELEHLVFGSILDAKGEPFKTRSGDSVLLNELLDEAVQHALSIVREKSRQLTSNLHHDIANHVAIGAIKYADLSKNRVNDYKFDWQQMFSLEGNTSPYLQYAYARISSIFNRANRESSECASHTIRLVEPVERELGLHIIQFQEILELSISERKPHHMCSYLYGLTVRFMRFYERCPVLGNTDVEVKHSRLALCARTAQVLKLGLNCLGITVLDQM